MEITIAQKSDLAEILSLQKKCYIQEAEIYGDFQIPPLKQNIESINDDFENQTFLKVTSDDKIIGSVRGKLDRNTCEIGRLIVHPDFQNMGLGRKLMQAIEEKYHAVRHFELFTGHKSHKNLSFYQKLGYKEFDRQVVNDGLSLVYLEKMNTV